MNVHASEVIHKPSMNHICDICQPIAHITKLVLLPEATQKLVVDYNDLVLQYYELEDHYNAESNANNELQMMLDEKDELYKHTVSSVMYTNVTHM